MTPQIDCHGKTSPVLRVSTHIYGVSKDIGGKTFIFQLNLVFNWHHFATDCLHAVKMPMFYCCHFQLSTICNWPSSGVCPVYNIPSVGVKCTSSVLWSSANFCSISQNMHYKAPVPSQQRPTKWSGHGKMIDHPGELLLTKDLLPKRVTI